MSPAPTVTVVICAYTLDRWELLCTAVASAGAQSRPPVEIILSIDHNEELFAKATEQWASGNVDGIPITVVANKYDGRLGSARTTASEIAVGDILAFLDDDARARNDWLEHLVVPYGDESVLAVGGAPIPDYGAERPGWFPHEYNWVFGCVYIGLPEETAPTKRLIGANMSVRRQALADIGGFHSDNHDDMDMCHRLLLHRDDARIMFEPSAKVDHFVHPERLTWDYFSTRCFRVNRGKVAAHRNIERDIPGANNLAADADFARRTLTSGVFRELRAGVTGDLGAFGRIGAMTIGVVLAAAGYAVGTFDWWRSHR